ncbi:FAD-dependent oxidoreductase [Clostridium sporogenes]|uniref:FAD-dependent oxidoreductase n=1 Tax=Clostridium botulinum TaxID=1491 RepID=A0A6M0SWT5_CLOBO|nr:FAD-dependent oxidoreductase [Clostridium sporogenes]NFA58982.1 FAD-dependent oxidoreductase [Clostridium botulinum]NFI73565.1 FAD-dependent oxidoreductase [Clostridium sporogenes]NFL71616.1 FAD-dependent oxidoreductase [Clostridium sporogenes]NFM25793.1 FAD-dependent oxidoreductase [Clostridium sporogenes]NFP61187.1 FAD-dependent oxidoreductase [Clostridium sporogenes]
MVKKKVLKLANKIAGGITGGVVKVKPTDSEYKILATVTTDEMAEVALHLEIRKPKSVEEVADLCKKPADEVEKILYKMAVDGSVKVEKENGVDKYFLELYVPGVMEYMVANRENIKKYPVIPESFEEYTRKLGALMAGNIPVGMGVMRVIPIESAIEGDTRRASYEEISDLINKHEIFSVADCACRTSMRVIGQGCGHTVEEMCIQLGPAAEYYIRTGRGRRITREEAISICKKAEKEGLIHQIPNLSGPGKTLAICNCCGCSCFGLRNANLYRNPDFSRSNYISQVDKDKCVACGQCVENCPSNALTLGQNLCAKKPIKVEKEKETPYDTKWGKDKWNPDYRHRKVVAEGGTSPCKSECPAHIAIQGYIKMASQGKYREALELIKKENPFPAICGRICPRKCESACTRSDVDEPLAIDEIKKFIADQDLKEEHRFVPERKNDRAEKIAVIGAGPAGLSCAYFLAVDGYKVTVFEKEKKLGGMLALGIPSFRLGKEVVNAEIDILKELGVEFKTGVEVGKDTTFPELRELGYKAFYLAIGAQAGRNLGIEGEEEEGVMTGVDFLRKINLGEDLKMDGEVIVIGGGNVAIDVARTTERIGASQVDMYCLENREEMPALGEEIEEALSEGISINNSWGPKRIIQENGRVVGVEFKKCISVFDENRKFNPKFDENETKIVKANSVLISVGQGMNWGGLLKDTKIELNPNKTIKADPITFQTGEVDVFAGGDVLTGPKFAIDAIALGKQGAISIHRYVHGDNLTISREREYRALDKENVNMDGYDRLPRQRPLHVEGNESKVTFKDLRGTFTEEEIEKETKRCLGCGAVVVDQYQCVGCGMCTIRCKFDAISLIRKYDSSGLEFKDMKPAVIKHVIKRQGRIAVKSVRKSVKSIFSREKSNI